MKTEIIVKPRVTEIIKVCGLGKDYTNVDPFYRDRGTALHAAIQMYLAGELDETSIDESYRGHFQGFLAWWGDYKTKLWKSELHLENAEYQGTIDLLMNDAVIWDFKASKNHDKVAEIQLAGYKKLCLDNMLVNAETAKIVQFPGDGSYRVFDYEAPIELWESVWKIYQWKIRRR